MKYIEIDCQWFVVIDYHQYIANNLSQFGCAIFDSLSHPNFDFEILKKELLKDSALEKMFVFPINVYNQQTKDFHTYWAFVNDGRLSPFMFFDKVRLACSEHHLNKFYACDFEIDKIFEMTPTSVFEYGKLNKFKNLLKLENGNQIVGKCIKWCVTLGYSRFYSQAKVFRNGTDNEYYTQYGKDMSQYSEKKLNINTYYSLSECQDKLSGSCLEFDKMTELEFDIDNPELTIKAPLLKAQNLNIKNIEAEKVFCYNLKCDKIKAKEIYAEGIECKELEAETVRINAEYGIRFVGPK